MVLVATFSDDRNGILFLDFLSGNDILLKDGTKRISDGELVAITLMIAESKPEEKEIMVSLVMNFLTL